MPISSFVLYRGPSMLDGAPIVVVATGLQGSQNTKTGAGIVQTYILREDLDPVSATHNGADASICGACPHRGRIENGRNVSRSCYVSVFQGPQNVFKSYHRGIYPALSLEDASDLVAGGVVRLGTYGDPAAVPLHVWRTFLSKVRAKTGYTHQWRNAAFAELQQWCMASCDSVADFAEATAAGWRTFRIRAANEPMQAREIVCPASKEAGHKTTCDTCVACGGHTAKAKANVTIVVHGAAGKVNAYNARLAA